MNKVYLILGSNQGNKRETLEKAINEIGANLGSISKKSSLYETDPWGFDCKEPFINQVIEIDTLLQAETLLKELLVIENKLGRIRKSTQYEPRTIDIDILFYNNDTIEAPNLIVPHPRLHERKFTLIPFSELNQEYIHPTLNKTIKELLEECPDDTNVRLIN